MKSILFSIVVLFSVKVFAQTPIDELQKNNISYLELQESEGFEFRSQIITEFDSNNASQNVNIKLSKDFIYIVVALGDSNIPKISLDIKPANNAKMESMMPDESLTGQSFLVTPSKSGRFKISINAIGLEASRSGFISFMILRK
ncbi:MAG: hypothetical protein GDA51_09545 [Ekhidna sp.]|nr:hypothetical protein [Ekhidna sp.]MBC6409621.1 hypothetical protein [Ekhidna sp.]MBC6426690.1 hypothetical protein [Ekhidna sp.]